MPKSKRAKQVSLTKTTKRRSEVKVGLVQKIRDCLDDYSKCIVFAHENMRTPPFDALRKQLNDSKFVLGRNKVMQVALGVDENSSYKPNSYKLSQMLSGHVGLFFTNRSKKEVLELFAAAAEPEFARSGARVTEHVVLESRLLNEFPHSMMESLRKLGLPVALEKGVIRLTEAFTVCEPGDQLTTEQAQILKLFGFKTVHFRLKVIALLEDDVLDVVDTDSI